MSQWTFSIYSFFIRHKVVNKTTRYRMEFVNRWLIVNLLQASVDKLSNLCFSQPLPIGTFGMVTDGTKVIFFILKTTLLGRQNVILKSDLTLLNTDCQINLLNVFSHAKIVWAMVIRILWHKKLLNLSTMFTCAFFLLFQVVYIYGASFPPRGTHYNMARTKAFHAFGIFLYSA